MEVSFLNQAGSVLFVRNDMEQGNWTVEEYTVNATFPYIAGKVIERGQRMNFRDPATNSIQMFEIRNVNNIEPDHYQQIIAEHIVVSELSDDHINTTEITDQTPDDALSTVLSGTLWDVGNCSVTDENSVDIARGSVWQAVGAIMENWNCYIVPRVTVNTSGNITGRYLDISPAQGTWRGVLLSISKNMADSSVTYDDSEVYTALYGYGANVEVQHSGSDDTEEELTFADVVWTATADHPAKPLNQTYLEDPAKTALYGRNGRARFGYYQNGDIEDAETLLEKTWETLKQTSNPKISITGTVTDLYRMGYADQPLQLHDTVIVEIRETGEKFEKEIIKLDVDLIDPTATRPEIGDYIPNIIYINREEDEKGGGGGGGRAGDDQDEIYDTYSALEKMTDKYGSMIAMVVGRRNGDNYVKAGEIGLAINNSGESGSYETTAYINADHVNISATQTAYTLAGEMERDANGKLIIKSGGGLWVQRQDQGTTVTVGVWDKGNLDGGIMAQQINGQSAVKISGDVIDINGSQITISADRIDINGLITALSTRSLAVENMTMTANAYMLGNMTYQFRGVSWESQTVVTGVTVTGNHFFLYASDSSSQTPSGSDSGKLVSSVSTATINYLGGSNT